MRLYGLARVKNEGDVIEEFVRHNLRYLDGLTVVDNVSLDGTTAVLDNLRAEGLPLRVLHDATLPKRNFERVTSAVRRCASEELWDFLFLLDADEFIASRGRAELEASLATVPPGANGSVPWSTYVPTVSDPCDDPQVLRRIRHRLRDEPPADYQKCVLSRRFAETDGVAIGQGNHGASNSCGNAVAHRLPDVRLAHFPVRSVQQLQTKVLLGWGAYLALDGAQPDWGWHQRRLFEQIEAGVQWTAGDLHDLAVRYVDDGTAMHTPALTLDPLPPVAQRYGDASLGSSLQVASRYVRQLACALRDASVSEPPPRRTPIAR